MTTTTTTETTEQAPRALLLRRLLATDETGTLRRFLDRDRAEHALAVAASYRGTVDIDG